MANKRKDTVEIKQIILLHQKKVSNRKIAKRLNMSRNTVNGYISKIRSLKLSVKELSGLSEEKLALLFGQDDHLDEHRHQTLIAFFPEVLRSSKLDGFTYQEIWKKYRLSHPDGYGYTQFLEHYHRWNSKSEATLKLKHIVGECLLVDYAGKKLGWVDKETGEVKPGETFLGCLPASGYIYMEVSPSQKKEDFSRSMVNCLNYLGGSPQCIVVDNLKSAVNKSSKYEAIANRSLRDLALHYGSALNPTRPYRPQDKAMVERIVQLVYQQIYFIMRDEVYFSLHALNERIAELLEKLNARKLSQLNCSRKELFLSIEYPALRPLPPEPYQLKKYKRAKVQKTSHVYLSEDKHYYSVPCRYIGKHTRIHFSDRVVEVYHNHQRIATHHRNRTASGYSTKKEHLPSEHQFYLDWSPSFFINKARKIGPQTEQYIKRLFEQGGYAEIKYKTAMGIIHLQKQYDSIRIEKGCQLAILHPVTSYNRLAGILQKGLDQHAHLFDSTDDTASHIPPHDNIRGPDYFSDN
jgi:transposase